MDFDACSKCLYELPNDECDAADMMYEYYSEKEVDQIFFKRGFGCYYYVDNPNYVE